MPADLTPEDAARLLAAATPGPWYVVHTDDGSYMNSTYVGTVDRGARHDQQVGMDGSRIGEIVAVTLMQDPRFIGDDHGHWDEDADLIAAAPALARAVIRLEAERDAALADAERLRAEVHILRDVLIWSQDQCPGKCAGVIADALARGQEVPDALR